MAKTAYTFDDYAATGGMEGYGSAKPPSWDGAYGTTFTYRGNVTGVTQWIDIAAGTTLPTRLRKYDKFGNVLQEQVSCCKEKVFTYVENDYWANPPTVTNGDPQGLHLVGATTYDFNTGLPKFTEFANMGKRHFYYDAALRVIEHEWPVGGSETASYNDANMTAAFTKPGQGTTTVSYDGVRRPIQIVDANNGQVNTSYNAMSQVATRTNSFTAGGAPGPATSFSYDHLGRVTVVTLPDNQTIQTTYSGSDRLKRGGFMNAFPKRIYRGMARRIKRILVGFLFAAPSFFALACRSEAPLSKPPMLSELDPDGIVLRYKQEFNQMGEKDYFTPVLLDHTPDAPWQVYQERESSADFFRLRLRNNKSGDSRLLFTLWAADLGSGLAARVRWSKDGKALQISGDTKGFSYEPIPKAGPNCESFSFIYLVEEDKMYSVPRDGV